MCGILGFNWEDKLLLEEGLEVMRHRGPDAHGSFFDKQVSLGHNRLSILDLSSAGRQPMSNENGDIWITFNGEIYNYKEIKSGLTKKHSFSSETDTEVLIHLYEEEGQEMVKKLQGMFAFCIYDSKKKIFFMARDRMGKKPFYYYNKQSKFIFSSEIKGILVDRELKREVNKKAIPYFLAFRANTSPETMFKDIMKIKPGHTATYNLVTHEFKEKKYWELNINENEKDKNEDYFIDKLYSLLEDSVRCRLMSDVPYGAYLSGGVDSGTIVSLMSKFSSKPVKTFSVGFKEEEDPETNDAKFLAEKIGTEHHELLIDRKSVKHLPKIIWHLDEPMSDPTSIPIYLLSQYAKKYCTVILTGEGSDEIFAGYPQYKFMKMHESFVRKMPKFAKNSGIFAVKHLPSGLLNKGFKFASSLGEKGLERMSNFVKSNNYSEQYLNQIAIFNDEEQSEILDKTVNLTKEYESYFKNKNSIVSNCQTLDFNGNMVEDLLMKVDKNAMAFAVEGRVPFLDYRIVELAASMPNSLKLKGLSKDKYILRKTVQVKNLLPKPTGVRKKRHFFVPIDSWFNEELSSLKDELLSPNFLDKQKIFKSNYINKINQGFDKSKLFYSRQLWSLLTFQIWYKQYIQNEKVTI